MNRFVLEDEDIVILDEKVTNGGPGSGNFGHAGREGEVGGSSSYKVGVFDNPWDTGDSYWRPLLDAELRPGQTYSEYYRDEKDRETKVVEISPEDYLTLLQKGGHSVGMTHQELRDDRPSSIEFLRDKIKKGEPLPTPTLLLEKDGRSVMDQEGRHRLEAATLEGIEKVPVMIGYHHSNPKVDELLSGVEYKDITKLYRKMVTDYFNK